LSSNRGKKKFFLDFEWIFEILIKESDAKFLVKEKCAKLYRDV